MPVDDNLKAHLQLTGRLYSRAAAFPPTGAVPAGLDLKAELAVTCDWLVARQNDRGLWPEGRSNLRFYSDGYAVRGLLAGWRVLGDRSYLDAAVKWLRYLLDIQRGDGGWWVGYSAGDHDYDSPDVDRSVVYVADAGEVSLALVTAAHVLRGDPEQSAMADRITEAMLGFGRFCEHFRLISGGMGLGYTRRDFYSPGRRDMRTYMQAHHLPWTFATAVTGVNTYAGLFTLTGDRADWDKAMTSLDWVLDHAAASPGQSPTVASNDTADLTVLHRVMDWAFDCCDAPLDERGGLDDTPEPRFASPHRQRLYELWKLALHAVVDLQSELGEWPVFAHGRPIACYGGPLRHRLLFGYALTGYLQRLGTCNGEDDRLAEARDRQLWLAAEPTIRRDHYGVGLEGVHMMPTGLWAMTLAELIQPRATLPSGGS